MQRFIIILVSYYCLLVDAFPSYQSLQLIGVPDEGAYQHLVYAPHDIQDLGIVSQDQLPPEQVKVIRTIKLSIPEPYPVHIPHKVPYPVHIAKPYPVEVTKVVKVPQQVPVEVVKNVEVPVEVPKPYPVPSDEYKEQIPNDYSQQQQQPQQHEQQEWHGLAQQHDAYSSYENGHHYEQSVAYPGYSETSQQYLQQQQEPYNAGNVSHEQ